MFLILLSYIQKNVVVSESDETYHRRRNGDNRICTVDEEAIPLVGHFVIAQ
jgi:hypothetical protein